MGNEEIKAFAAAKGVEFDKGFDFFAKIDVNGKNAHPLWDYLKKKQGGTLTDAINGIFPSLSLTRKDNRWHDSVLWMIQFPKWKKQSKNYFENMMTYWSGNQK